MEAIKLLENLMNMLTAAAGPTHVTVGEAFVLHQTMAAFYYLRMKCRLFEGHAQANNLQSWWGDAIKAVESRIDELQQLMEKRGVPLPPSLPVVNELTDQFLAQDGAAMVAGMLQSYLIGLQSARHPDIVLFYRGLVDQALLFGATLASIMQKEGWMVSAPEYQAESSTTQ